jgi:2-polyprenyl-3-methyl-5-hydroxy-6-metoxy-1,4-benzoquinol methylase
MICRCGDNSFRNAFETEDMDQQRQTLDFFNATSREWRDKARGVAPKVNIIRQRNAAALAEADRRAAPGAAADLGCGTGELAIDLARRGWTVEGVDFAPEMIARCEEAAREAGVAATFRAMSMFDYAPPESSLDLIGGMGLIEYISPAQTEQLLAHCHRMLKPGGVLALGSRNRLFNAVSTSDYTTMELELGAIPALLKEAVAIGAAPDMASAIAAARAAAADLPHPKTHPHTAVGVETRYQFTPGQLIRLVERAGYVPTTLYPVHVHPMPVPAATALREAHISISEFLWREYPQGTRLLPYASSFVLAATRA